MHKRGLYNAYENPHVMHWKSSRELAVAARYGQSRETARSV